MKSRVQKYTGKNYWRLGVFVLAFIIILLNVYRLHHSWPYNSDGVELQNNVAVWGQGLHQKTILVSNNYLIRVPFYWILNHINITPRHALLITFSVFMLVTYFSFYIGMALINRSFGWFKEKYLALGFLYLTSLTQPYEYMINANVRNFELGLAYLFAVPLAVGFKKGLIRKYQLATAFLLSLLIFDDPYFLYAFYAPLLILIIIAALLNKKRVGHILVVKLLILAMIMSKIWSWLVAKFNIVLTARAINVVHHPSQLAANIKGTYIAFFLLGGADYYAGRYQLVPFSFYLNYVVMAILIIYSTYFILWNLDKFKSDPWLIFILGIPWVIAILYALQPPDQITNYRYLVIAPFGFPAIFALLATRSKGLIKGLVVLLVVVATLFNVQKASQLAFAADSDPNAINEQIVGLVKGLGLEKGYTDYWSSNIDTYFAQQKVYFLPVTCDANHIMSPMNWLLDTAEFNKVKVHESFYLYDKLGTYTIDCPISSMKPVFGQPVKVVDIGDRYQLAVYDYDIYSKMSLNVPYVSR